MHSLRFSGSAVLGRTEVDFQVFLNKRLVIERGNSNILQGILSLYCKVIIVYKLPSSLTKKNQHPIHSSLHNCAAMDSHNNTFNSENSSFESPSHLLELASSKIIFLQSQKSSSDLYLVWIRNFATVKALAITFFLILICKIILSHLRWKRVSTHRIETSGKTLTAVPSLPRPSKHDMDARNLLISELTGSLASTNPSKYSPRAKKVEYSATSSRW